MDASELATYEQQLAQVQSALALDQDNAELKNLEAELTNLINLTRQLVESSGSSSSAASASTVASKSHTSSTGKPAHAPHRDGAPQPAAQTARRYAAGDDCEAKYAADGRWYPARVVAVGGSLHDPAYTILFKGYGNTEIVTAESLRGGAPKSTLATAATASKPSDAVASSSATTREGSSLETDVERERKRKRNEKKAVRHASKTAEANAMQSSWQKFAKKAEKKGAIKSDKSMFKTPDDPLAKVGVVGAGRGMTQYHDRKKHTYDAAEPPS